MTYNYRYIPASMGGAAQKGVAPKNTYLDLFQETLNEQFYNSSNWWTVEEETAVGSGLYEEVDVRMAHVINSETGLKLGDDWKTVLFKNVTHCVSLGKLYVFNDNTWLTINTELIKNLTATCTIRRCNNTLRWINESTGAYYEEPCAIEYMVKEPRNYVTQGSPFMTPGGFIHIEAQLNERTNLIKENQRFLFGNAEHWTCYKIIGTGLNDFRNQETYDGDTPKILSVDLIADFVNDELDDVTNGIADVNTNVYLVTLSINSVSGSPNDTIQLTESVTYNGNSVTRDMEWASSNTSIASVSTSGSVTFVATGSCIITVNVEDNAASGSCLVTVSGSPTVNSEIIITPDTNYVLEGSTGTYSVYLYEDNVIQADVFAITCDDNDVPAANYTFTKTDGNHFTILNSLRDVSSYLTIECVSGSQTKSFDINLRGAWK